MNRNFSGAEKNIEQISFNKSNCFCIYLPPPYWFLIYINISVPYLPSTPIVTLSLSGLGELGVDRSNLITTSNTVPVSTTFFTIFSIICFIN